MIDDRLQYHWLMILKLGDATNAGWWCLIVVDIAEFHVADSTVFQDRLIANERVSKGMGKSRLALVELTHGRDQILNYPLLKPHRMIVQRLHASSSVSNASFTRVLCVRHPCSLGRCCLIKSIVVNYSCQPAELGVAKAVALCRLPWYKLAQHCLIRPNWHWHCDCDGFFDSSTLSFLVVASISCRKN